MTKLTPDEISKGVQKALHERDKDSQLGVGGALIVIQVILGVMCFAVGWSFTAPIGFSLLAITVLGVWLSTRD